MNRITAFIVLCLALASCSPVSSNIATGGASVTSQSATPAGQITTPAAGGTPLPITPSAPAVNTTKVPNFDHIILIVLENRDYQNVIGGTSTPFLNSLASQNVLLSNYFGIRHPSLPNYLALISGSTQGTTKDCTDCFVDQPNLADLIESSGRTWKDYQENMPSPCYVGNAAPYYQKHNPFIYFNSIRLNPARCQRSVVPLTSLDADLASNSLPNFAFIMPNICNSGHDCPAETADTWVKNMVTRLQASPALGKNSLIVVTFDEGAETSTGTCCGLGSRGGGQVATILVSPLARPGYNDTTAYSHYSLLKTILTAWSLPALANTSLAGTEAIIRPWNTSADSGAAAVPPAVPAVLTSAGPNSNAAPVNLSGCATGTPASGKYNLNLCLSAPAAGSSLSGDVTVSADLKLVDPSSGSALTGSRNPIQRVVFYLDGTYLLSDYQSPYTFTLPSANWVDGKHTLTVEAQMRDTFVSPQAGLVIDFKNGVSQAPTGVPGKFQPTSGSSPVSGAPFLVMAAGDAASGETNASNVSNLIASLNPDLLLYLGDVYERGSPTEYLNWFGGKDGTFGRFKSITDPTIGNHEYLTDNAAGYFNYWNNIPDYYSYDVNIPGAPGGWHFISLNSNTTRVPASPDGTQYQWLAADLAAHAGACTIVYYHHPLFNIGAEGPTVEMQSIWKLLAQYGVTLVLNGHDHTYQRWQPLDGEGLPKPDGITEIVEGASGHGLQTFKTTDNRMAFGLDSNNQLFGALLLQLNPDGAQFSFHATDGSIPDSGVIPCVGRGTDNTAPSAPGALTGTASTSTQVDLAWSPASDNTGVAGYLIFRNGLQVAKVSGASLSYSDTGVEPNTAYSYTVAAVDPAGNRSPYGSTLSVSTPDVSPHQAFNAVADTYITIESPTTNYGSSQVLRVDSSPDVRTYLQFNVKGLGGRAIASAVLRLHANSGSNRGLTVFGVPDNGWAENTLTFASASAPGQALTTSAGFKAGDWITLDVTAYITGEGVFSLGLTTPGSTSISFSSRESGQFAPQLVIDLR